VWAFVARALLRAASTIVSTRGTIATLLPHPDRKGGDNHRLPLVIRTARIKSLAKINLDLRVLAKQPDGFHDLRTVFQTVSLADEIEIEFERARRRDVAIEDALAIPDNLILKAAHAILDEMNIAARVRFRLKKNIPMGGGLGGGSSNAAAVLLALPVLAGKTVPMERLGELASGFGSDVPFFLYGGTELGFGRGGELYPMADVHLKPILLVTPDLHVATGPAYQALGRGLTFTGSSSSINNFQAFVRALDGTRDAVAAGALSGNDFETVAFRQHPQLRDIAARLRTLSPAARMSGSGSTVFALFESEPERERAVNRIGKDRAFKGCRVMKAELVSRRGYERLWRRQLKEHLVPKEDLWPPRSRYAR
jgi:4-diphosphocytidyl-2-C-methyl-D-erythritol kinase